jgi:hypothetical protein
MKHRIAVGPGFQDIPMESPFGRREKPAIVAAVKIHLDDIVRLHSVITEACRRNQKAVAGADREISGGPLIRPSSVHLPADIDHLQSKVFCHLNSSVVLDLVDRIA